MQKTDPISEADKEVERILNMPAEEIRSEFEQLPGGVAGHVARMRELIKQGVERANQVAEERKEVGE